MVLIESIEDACTADEALRPMFRFILQILYDASTLKDESLMEWISARESESGDSSSPRASLFRQPEVQEFVAWLKEEESDDDDDSDEEDDDDASV
jgi:hypothetical protein